jgi:putative PEP-CTERM system histidine kinase
MLFPSLLSLLTVAFCCGLAGVVLVRDARSFPHQVFAAGMIALALEAALSGLSVQAESYLEVITWQRRRFAAAALLPSLWLVFSLTFARANYRASLHKWRWLVLTAVVLPLGIVIFGNDALFIDVAAWDVASRWVLGLGWTGYLSQLFLLMVATFIVINLESTFRSSTGSIRWQIKFLVLGLGGFFAVRIYTTSQMLLFSSLTSTLETLNVGALLIGASLIALSFRRSRTLRGHFSLSGTALYHSFSLLLIGAYLLLVGLLAKVVGYLGDEHLLPLQAFLLFLSLLALVVLLVSDEWRVRSKRFLNRHFHRPQYDYRREWARFTQHAAASLLDPRELCATTVKMVSETFGVPCVSIWLVDENDGHLRVGGSTVFSEEEARELKVTGSEGQALTKLVGATQWPIDFEETREDWAGEFRRTHAHMFREARVRYCAPLRSGLTFLGVLTLDGWLTSEPFSLDDYELLKLIADQTASTLLNIRLSQQLVKTKEIEAFQTLSAFFVHDLKNLASTLSLTVQNLSVHFDNPEFRQDVLRVIARSADKMNAMCGRLSTVTKHLELHETSTDLNALISATLADLNGSMKASVVQDLRSMPRLEIDSEQIQKVLLNLLLNAQEATGPCGEIRVSTEQRDEWAVVAVADNGRGMSKDFLEKSLFRPFQTTKSKGLGIGLFHSKKIVEAHHGRLEAESEEGKGSTFRVWLPVLGVKDLGLAGK